MGIESPLFDTPSFDENWKRLVSWSAEQYGRGMSEKDASRLVAGQTVRLKGRVSKNRLGASFGQGLQLDMSPFALLISDGSSFIGDYLFLPVDDIGLRDEFSNLRETELVEFEASLRQSDGYFHPIEFTVDEENNQVFLKLGLAAARKIRRTIDLVR